MLNEDKYLCGDESDEHLHPSGDRIPSTMPLAVAHSDRVAMVVMVLGYELDLLTLLTTSDYYVSRDGAVEAMFIIAFLFYSLAAILVVIVNLTELRESIPTILTTTTLSFLASLFLIVGLAVYGSDLHTQGGSAPAPYCTTTYSISLVLGLVGGLFLSLHLTGLKAEGVSVPMGHQGSVGSVTRVVEAGK